MARTRHRMRLDTYTQEHQRGSETVTGASVGQKETADDCGQATRAHVGEGIAEQHADSVGRGSFSSRTTRTLAAGYTGTPRNSTRRAAPHACVHHAPPSDAPQTQATRKLVKTHVSVRRRWSAVVCVAYLMAAERRGAWFTWGCAVAGRTGAPAVAHTQPSTSRRPANQRGGCRGQQGRTLSGPPPQVAGRHPDATRVGPPWRKVLDDGRSHPQKPRWERPSLVRT